MILWTPTRLKKLIGNLGRRPLNKQYEIAETLGFTRQQISYDLAMVRRQWIQPFFIPISVPATLNSKKEIPIFEEDLCPVEER